MVWLVLRLGRELIRDVCRRPESPRQHNAVGTSLAASGAVVGSGNTVIGSFSIDSSGGGDIVSVTDDKGNTYTVVDNVNDAANVQRFCSFVLGNIANGPSTITAGSTSKSFRTVTWEEISGVAALSDPRDGHGGQLQTAPGTSSNGVTSGSVTTTVNGDLIWGATCNSSDGTVPSVGSGFAAGTGDSDGAIIVTENRTQTTAWRRGGDIHRGVERAFHHTGDGVEGPPPAAGRNNIFTRHLDQLHIGC